MNLQRNRFVVGSTCTLSAPAAERFLPTRGSSDPVTRDVIRPTEVSVFKFLACLAFCMPITSLAQSPFVGTWEADPARTTFGGVPLTLAIERGTFVRRSCRPSNPVPTDGADHAVPGDPFADTVAVRLIDRERVEIRDKKGSRIVWRGAYTVAQGGKSMRLDYEDNRAVRPVTGSVQFVREGDPATNAHVLSGTWQAVKTLALSPTGRGLTIRDIENGVALSASDGRSFEIHFDRQDYPLQGYLDGATVQVGRRTPNTLQVNRKQDGTLVDMTLGVVAADGRTMTWGAMDWQCQIKTSLTMTKQPAP